MTRIGKARQTSQQPAEEYLTTNFVVPSSHEAVASRATDFISHTTTPPYNGLGLHRSAQPYHPSMMQILNHPAPIIHHNASASTRSVSKNFNAPQATNQFALATTSSSAMEQYLPCHGQGIIQGQYSTSTSSTPNHNNHFSPYEYPNAPQYENTQISTNFSPPGVHGVGSDVDLFSFYPLESTYSYPPHYGPWEQSQNFANSSADPGLDGQPKLHAALSPGESQSSTNRSGCVSRLSYPPIQPSGGRLHGGDPYQGSLHHTPYSPTEEVHHCHWLRSDNVPCGFAGSQGSLKDHIISKHLSGPQDAPIVCLWEGCHYFRRGKPEVCTMRRDSAWRHVREMHLNVKFRKKVKAL